MVLEGLVGVVLVLWVVGGVVPKKKFLQDLETIRSMILQDLACKITIDFGTISGEIMPDES